MLVLYHELVHVGQDTEFRRGITTPRALDDYMNFYRTDRSRRPRVIGAWEHEAYLKEIFVMNALMDGRVKRDAENSSFNADEYLRALNTPPSMKQAVEMLFGFAQAIYNSNSNLSNIAPAYADIVNTHYRRDQGYDIYRLTSEKQLELVP